MVGGPQYRVGSHRQFVQLARALADSGYPVFRFDYRGMGDSEGSVRTFRSVSDDIRAAIDSFHGECSRLTSVVLWGLCDAASASLMYCASDDRISGLILANPWVRTEEGEARACLQQYYTRRLTQRSFWRAAISGRLNLFKAARDFAATVRRAGAKPGKETDARRSFLHEMCSGFEAFSGPVLVLISERDLTAQEFVDLCSYSSAWRSAMSRHGIAVVRLAGADHTFSTREALDAATEHCRRWLIAAWPNS